MKNKISDVLKKAKKKISDPKHWTQEALARFEKDEGFEASSTDPEAVRWCALGAIAAVAPEFVDEEGDSDYLPLLDIFADLFNVDASAALGHVVDLNDADDTTHKDVMKFYDDAIKLALIKEKIEPQVKKLRGKY